MNDFNFDNTTENISVWVGCLASYNAGGLYGKWIDLEDECENIDDFYTIAKEMLENSPTDNAEEWDIFDTDNLPTAFSYEDIKTIFEIIDIKKNCDAKVFEAACNIASSVEDIKYYIDRFLGFYKNEVDFAKDMFFSDSEQIPEYVLYYIDWEKYSKDVFHDHTYEEKTGAVFADY